MKYEIGKTYYNKTYNFKFEVRDVLKLQYGTYILYDVIEGKKLGLTEFMIGSKMDSDNVAL